MKKLFISLLAAASLATPALANKNLNLNQASSGDVVGNGAMAEPQVTPFTPEATGCMILRECKDGVTQVFSILNVSSRYSDPDKFDIVADEFNYMLMYLTQIGIEVFIANPEYFGIGHRGLYHSKYNKFFLNSDFMGRPSALMAVMRHEGWHAAQDCMAGTIDNTFIALIKPEEDVPQFWQDVTKRTYAGSPALIWEKEAMWAGHTEGMTLNALQACASPKPMWETYEPTPLTRKYLIDYGFIKE